MINQTVATAESPIQMSRWAWTRAARPKSHRKRLEARHVRYQPAHRTGSLVACNTRHLDQMCLHTKLLAGGDEEASVEPRGAFFEIPGSLQRRGSQSTAR